MRYRSPRSLRRPRRAADGRHPILKGAVDGRIAGAERSRYHAFIPRRVEEGRVGPVLALAALLPPPYIIPPHVIAPRWLLLEGYET